MLPNPVLAFIKAFRLHGSIDKLKHSALSKFDAVLIVSAQKALWDCTDVSKSLNDAGISHVRRGSDKRSQAAAILDEPLISWMSLATYLLAFAMLMI